MVQVSADYGAGYIRLWCRLHQIMVQVTSDYIAGFSRLRCRLHQNMVQVSAGLKLAGWSVHELNTAAQ